MQAFFIYGPIVLSACMMAIMVYTSLRVWRAHKRAMQRLDEYNDAMEAATKALRENPERWLDFHKNLDDIRRKH